MEKVSFVVTVFNKEPFLRRVVEGLRNQVGPFASEFIFVNDGSTDDSARVLGELIADLPNATLVSQANLGPSAALNAGLALALGTIIKPVDGDDVLAPWATLHLLHALKQTGCAVAASRVALQASYPFIDDGRIPFRRDRTPGAARPPEPQIVDVPSGLAASIRRPMMTPTAMMFARAALREIGGCDPEIFVQDYSLELRLVSRFSVAWIDSEAYASPVDAPGRLSGNVVQTLHDVNYALQRFLGATPQLPRPLVEAAIRRATGRAWHFARRSKRQGVLSGAFARFLAARYTPAGRDPALIAQSCETFRASGPIRYGQSDRACEDASNLVHLDAVRRRTGAARRSAIGG